MTERAWTIALALLVLAAAIGTYLPSTSNDFVWDDPIVFKRQLPYFDSFRNVFFPPKSIPQFGQHYYRPLIVVSYQLDEWAARTFWPPGEREEARRFVYHASCVAWHGLATLVVFLLGLVLGEASRLPDRVRASAAAAGALLFAVHPIHVESVSWMAGRSDVIAGVFFLGALALYVRHRRTGQTVPFVLSLVLAFAGMLAKETGTGLVLLVPFVDLLVRPGTRAGDDAASLTRAERRRRARERRAPATPRELPAWLRWAAFAAVLAAYLLLRRAALAGMGGSRPPVSAGSLPGRFLGAVGWYVVKFLWPPPQSAFVSTVPGGGYAALGFVALALAGALAWVAWRKRVFPGETLAGVLFFAALAPSLAIAVLRISETPLAERYLYIPSAGGCLLAGFLLARGAAAFGDRVPALAVRLAPVVLAVLLAAPMARATLARERAWHDDLAFWTDTVAKAPEEGLPHLHLGLTYARMGYDDRALEEYEKAFARYDDAEGRSKALNNMATVFMGRGEFDRARESLERALREVPRYPTAFYNRGICEINLAREAKDPRARAEHLRRALRDLREALRLNPRYVKAHLQYGKMLVRLGKHEEGIRHLREAARLAPTSRAGREARALLDKLDRKPVRGAPRSP